MKANVIMQINGKEIFEISSPCQSYSKYVTKVIDIDVGFHIVKTIKKT
jgi:hypothetical protein